MTGLATAINRALSAGTATNADSSASGPDTALLLEVNAFARATPWLHGLFYACATDGTLLFAALLLAGWATARRSTDPTRMAAAAWTALGTVLALAVSQPIVTAVHEARPYTVLHGLLVLADRTVDYSFPSDHAIMAGAVAAGLFLVQRRLGVTATVAAVVIAFSRVYIAAQYPQDVAAGLVLGAGMVLLGWAVVRMVLTAFVRRLRQTPLRPLVAAAPDDVRGADGVGQTEADAADRSRRCRAG